MLPVWPFRSRAIRHRTFGTLKPVRNGKFWHARVPCPRGGRHPLSVQITAHPGGPSEAQEHLFLRLRQSYANVFDSALRAVHDEYRRLQSQQPYRDWPGIDNPGDLERVTPLEQIWLDDVGGRQFVLSFQHKHDREHSFHVFFADGKLRSVASER